MTYSKVGIKSSTVYKLLITEYCNIIFIHYLLEESRLAKMAFVLSFIMPIFPVKKLKEVQKLRVKMKLLTVWAMVRKFGPRVLRALLGEDENYSREHKYWDDMY